MGHFYLTARAFWFGLGQISIIVTLLFKSHSPSSFLLSFTLLFLKLFFHPPSSLPCNKWLRSFQYSSQTTLDNEQDQQLTIDNLHKRFVVNSSNCNDGFVLIGCIEIRQAS